MDEKVFRDQSFAIETNQTIPNVVNTAVKEHLQKLLRRPAFRKDMNEVLDEHESLLGRLAK